jgi:hypothetical protein
MGIPMLVAEKIVESANIWVGDLARQLHFSFETDEAFRISGEMILIATRSRNSKSSAA